MFTIIRVGYRHLLVEALPTGEVLLNPEFLLHLVVQISKEEMYYIFFIIVSLKENVQLVKNLVRIILEVHVKIV